MKHSCLSLLLAVALCLTGCEKTNNSSTTDGTKAPATETTPATSATLQQKKSESSEGITDTISNAFSGAAGNVSEFAGGVYDDAVTAGSDVTEGAVDLVTSLYESAKETGETQTTNARDWVMGDLKKGGSWQYRVLQTPHDPKAQQAALTEAGKARWECYSVARTETDTLLYLKRPARSVIRSLPAKELLRLLPLLGGEDGE
jgi:hypothetical protein